MIITDFIWFWTLIAILVVSVAALWTLRDWLAARTPWHAGNSYGIYHIMTPWWYLKFGEGIDACTLTEWSGIEVWRRVPGTTWGPTYRECFRKVWSYDPKSRYQVSQ